MTQAPSYIAWIRGLIGDAKIILNAACVVIPNDKGEILLQQRSDNQLWGLPGGLMELGESIAQTAIREVKEETNLDVTLTGFVGVFVNPAMTWRKTDKAQVICHSFVGAIAGGTLAINDGESLNFGWFGPDNLPCIHSSDNAETIQAFFKGQRNLIEGRRYS
ncbi:MAG: NUDIX domain-containing protein [bacterium]